VSNGLDIAIVSDVHSNFCFEFLLV